VLNAEDDAVLALAADAPGARRFFRTDRALAADQDGAYLGESGDLTMRRDGRDESLVHVSELKLLGRHNHANALAAAVAAVEAGADSASVATGLRSFGGLEHRLEPVIERDGVLWINDSKATNIGSTRVALASMSRPTVLLLGGRHKGEPYTLLRPEIDAHVTAVVAYGEAASVVERDLSAETRVVRVDGAFEQVIERAREIARAGDAILLSPACSSFDMFRDYEDRGRRFKALATAGGETDG
jgi:UDP-N-acetylmuramoylalanine--D-glutamate ligase